MRDTSSPDNNASQRARPRGNAIRYTVDPRDIPPEKVARLLHQTPDEFEARKAALFDRGFPQPDPTTGMYDMVAINAWMDQRHRLTSGASTERQTARNTAEVAAERQRRLLNG